MILDQEQLNNITKWAEALMDLEEVAILMDIEPHRFMEEYQKKESVFKSYQRGILKTKASLNLIEITNAKNHSEPAMKTVLKLLSNLENKIES